MAVEDRDLRMLLVAFEDAATWCETLAGILDEWIAAARNNRPIASPEIERVIGQVAETRRFLESNRHEVERIVSRAGLM